MNHTCLLYHLLNTYFKKLEYKKTHSAKTIFFLIFSVDWENLWQLGSEDLIMHEHQLSNWKGSGLGVHGSRDLCVELCIHVQLPFFREFILCQALSFGFYMNYLFFKIPAKIQARQVLSSGLHRWGNWGSDKFLREATKKEGMIGIYSFPSP